MKKTYILLIREKDRRYEDMFRYYYKYFDDYFSLQKHLKKFWYIEESSYIVYEETDIKRDYSLNNIIKGGVKNE